MLLTFHIQLDNIINPAVWRKVVVPGNFSFYDFHFVIQCAFGWENAHLYQFSEKGYGSDSFIGLPTEDNWDEVEDSEGILLEEVFKKKNQKLIYIYDFGDDWIHTIKLENLTEGTATKADCIAGEGNCPPEDCGGPWGYALLRQKLDDPKHPEHKDLREWLGLKKGKKWDAAAFDLEKTKKAVRKV